MELENHPLRHEIIKCVPTGPPRFEVQSDTTDDFEDEELKSLIKEKHLKELDPSQRDAYLHALENKVAIIQG